ncbi:MAG: hypothetical protein ACYCOO_10695, partial [Chitinophagaceae bacterium]
MMIRKWYLVIALICCFQISRAQDNYEIQVYGADLVAPNTTMVELHSNFTFDGSKSIHYGVLPTEHVFHETIEITHGFNPWLEVGFYFFNSIGSDGRTQYVGSHIRPRIAIPDSFHWPVGLSLSTEVGFQKSAFSEDTWTLEIRPIIDKKINHLYLAFNPAFDKSLQGLNVNQGFVYSPNFKVGYDISKTVSPGLEYYGSIGPLNDIAPFNQQQHQIFLVVDLNWDPKWEFNA